MLQLRCRSCNHRNVVPDGATVLEVRCAGCDGALDATREVRYFVADGGTILGPLPFSELQAGIRKRRFSPDMLYSEEGEPWVRGESRDDLFPERASDPRRQDRLRPMAPLPPPGRPRPRRAGTPGSVTAMAVLDHVSGAFLLVLGMITAGFARELGSGGGVLVLILFGLSALHIVVGIFLVRASRVARAAQLVLVGAAVVGLLAATAQGAPLGFLLVGLFLSAVPVLLLVNEDANAFFGRRPTERAGRGAARPGGSAGR